MAGICGWITSTRDQRQTDNLIDRMAAKLPSLDGQRDKSISITRSSGSFSGEFVAYDESSGVQAAIEGTPFWSDKRLADIATAQSHAHALIRSYLDNPETFLNSIRGSFALAVANERSDRILLAVDRLGQRPLCYARNSDDGLVFGSNLSAVLEYPGINSQISQQALYDYMYFHVVPSPSTVYQDIFKLEPGEMISMHRGSIQKSSYWVPKFINQGHADQQKLETEFTECVRNSVIRCRPDNNTGCFLSGGLDSSTVSGMTREITDSSMRAYSIGFQQDGYDEMEYARQARDHFKLDLREYYVTPDDIADSMQIIAAAYDEPFGNSSAIPAYFCAKHAKSEGVETLLAGDGGDEIFGGNERYATQKIFGRYTIVPQWIRVYVIEPLLFRLPTNWSYLTRKARRYVEQARVSMPERLQTYNYLHMHPPESVFSSNFLTEVETLGPIKAMERRYTESVDADLLNKMLFLDWKFTLADNDLRKVNRMCEIAGIRVRYPLLDDELIEMSTRVPSQLKMKDNQLRYFFKKALDRFLPQKILNKEKHGFGLPFGEWLRTSENLRNAVFPHLESIKQRKIYRDEFVDDLIHRHNSEHAAYYGNIIWVLTMLEMWLQAHAPETKFD